MPLRNPEPLEPRELRLHRDPKSKTCRDESLSQDHRLIVSATLSFDQLYDELPPAGVYGKAAGRLEGWPQDWRRFGSPVREGRHREGPSAPVFDEDPQGIQG